MGQGSRLFLILVLPSLGSFAFLCQQQQQQKQQWGESSSSSSSVLCMKPLSREDEIRRKIVQLKKTGKLTSEQSETSLSRPSYEDKVKERLGKKKSKLLGYGGGDDDDDDDDDELLRINDELEDDDDDDDDDLQEDEVATDESAAKAPRARIGALPEPQQPMAETETMESNTTTPSSSSKKPIIDPSLFQEVESSGDELSEEDLIELVAQKLSEKRKMEAEAEEEAKKQAKADREAAQNEATTSTPTVDMDQQQLTTGVGGKWIKDDNDDESKDKSSEYYQPKSGSWGAFPRPKDISKAYGGGRRVGPGFSNEDSEAANIRTQRLLKDYRQKVGIDVPTEKEHASEIEEALQIARRAMQRGVYATAVSALEKVTKWCSTNSPVGSKVFLELAMAYEANGRMQEAYKVYQTLTKCRMEDVKHNAKRLLYGLEAMEFMKGVSSDFARTKVKNTFVDATGLRDIAQNFDDVYQTAYVDLDSGFYKKLTESVVRSNREARQILLKAVGRGEVGRLRIVQALRSIARHFDDALDVEIANNQQQEPTAYLDGKPLIVTPITKPTNNNNKNNAGVSDLDEFVLASSEIMLQNLDGTWRLQLLADKQGDGVNFFNTTTALQTFRSEDMTFSASGPDGLRTMKSSGEVVMDDTKRILSRQNVQVSKPGGGLFDIFTGGRNVGFSAAISRDQQIVSVDSVLLITRNPPGSRKGNDADKEHFGVWRRVATSDEEESGSGSFA